MMSELEKDNSLEFRSEENCRGGREFAITLTVRNGRLEFKTDDGDYLGRTPINLDRVWERVKTEVTFEEAVKALAEGKQVYSVYDAVRVYYKKIDHVDQPMRDLDGEVVTFGRMMLAKWYVG